MNKMYIQLDLNLTVMSTQKFMLLPDFPLMEYARLMYPLQSDNDSLQLLTDKLSDTNGESFSDYDEQLALLARDLIGRDMFKAGEERSKVTAKIKLLA